MAAEDVLSARYPRTHLQQLRRPGLRAILAALAFALSPACAADEPADPMSGRVELIQPAFSGDAPDLSTLGSDSGGVVTGGEAGVPQGVDPMPDGGAAGLSRAQVIEMSLVPAADLTQPPTSLWTRLRLGFGMPDLVHPAVRQEEDFYANRPEHLRRVVERSRRYLFHIVEVVEQRGMPSELALLPIIESAFNPGAVSSARAAGMWQFIPSTGLNFGLRQNAWLDGRRDILLSTEAALDYLQKLYDMFGSWDLALAAYNCGEGCVQRAIARNALRGERVDFSSLQLPAETRAYVPKLQAVKNIVANPRQFNMTLAEVPNEPYFGTVQIEQHMEVKVAARLAGMSVEDFVALNPAHNRSVINANKLPTLLLPLDRLNQFAAGLADLGDRALAPIRIYTPRAGEPLEQIARRHGVSLATLRRANQIPPRAIVAGGDVDLLIPTGAEARLLETAARATPRADARVRASGPGAAGNRQAQRPVATSQRQRTAAARTGATPNRAAAAAPRKAKPPTPPSRPTVIARHQGAPR
jgi:membrane-bound lytic murein transglycosylase D